MLATYLGEPAHEMRGDARLYKLDPPMQYQDDLDDEIMVIEYVVVSGAFAPFSGLETFIFPSDPKGNISDWGELPGSFQGFIDHEQALAGAGYQVALPPAPEPKAIEA